MGEPRARVLVVEDEGPLRLALEVALRNERYEVRAEADGAVVERAAAAFQPDLAVLDVRLPEGPDGYAIAQRLREASPLPIIFVTGADSMEDRLAGFKAGGDDYVVKPFLMPELLARVEALLRRAGKLHSGTITVGDLVVDADTGVVVRAGKQLCLTPVEHKLLCALAHHRGKVLSKSRLLSLVWSFASLDHNLVEVHVCSLRRKLERYGPRLLHTERERGYVLRA